MSRIDNDISILKRHIEIVDAITANIMRHAQTLGYFQNSKLDTNIAPSPVITTLADALQALEKSLDHCSGTLNVFD